MIKHIVVSAMTRKCFFIDQCEADLSGVYSNIYSKSVFSYGRIHYGKSIRKMFIGTCYDTWAIQYTLSICVY